MELELKVRVGRDIHAKARMFGLVFHDDHRRGQDTHIAKLKGGVMITQIGNIFSIGL
jgi:hypothetical protein